MKRLSLKPYPQSNVSGSTTWVLNLGSLNGKRQTKGFSTKSEALTYAAQFKIQKQNEGLAAFTLPLDKRSEASKAIQILGPDVSLTEAAKYYRQHVLAYKTAPLISKIVEDYVKE